MHDITWTAFRLTHYHSNLQKKSERYLIKSQLRITYHAEAHVAILSDFPALSVALSSNLSVTFRM